MLEAKKIDLGTLREAVKEFNRSRVWEGILDKKLNPIQRFDVLKEKFMEAIEMIPEEKEDQIPDLVVETYNALVDVEELEGGEQEEQNNDKEQGSGGSERIEESRSKPKGRGKGSKKGFCRVLMKEGKEREEILEAIAGLYVKEGKDKKYGLKRAKCIYRDISKEGIKDSI